MTRYVKMLVVPALVLAAACGRDEKPMDDALKNEAAVIHEFHIQFPGVQMRAARG